MVSEWRDNPGHLPPECRGKRVAVHLRDGSIHGEKPVSPTAPLGWAADGKGGLRWSFTKGPANRADVMHYRILGR